MGDPPVIAGTAGSLACDRYHPIPIIRPGSTEYEFRTGTGTRESTMSDRPMFDRINELAREEEELWERAGDGDGLTTSQTERLEVIRVELDQCFDLLHQRQARRSAGLDPEGARVRPPGVIERYQQ
jgi:hypothetical protein